MIGDSTVVTAGHCIYDGTKYAYSVTVTPGMNSDATKPKPFGSCIAFDKVVPSAWVLNQTKEDDYGVYRLGCFIGKNTGTLGFKVTTDSYINQKAVQLTGYPGDKPGRTMWYAYGNITSYSSKGVYYDVDMARGQSGSPVWDYTDLQCNDCSVAINNSEFAAPTMNFGARIDNDAFNLLLQERFFQLHQVFLPAAMNN
jgi:glutamyl endopeptidase